MSDDKIKSRFRVQVLESRKSRSDRQL